MSDSDSSVKTTIISMSTPLSQPLSGNSQKKKKRTNLFFNGSPTPSAPDLQTGATNAVEPRRGSTEVPETGGKLDQPFTSDSSQTKDQTYFAGNSKTITSPENKKKRKRKRRKSIFSREFVDESEEDVAVAADEDEDGIEFIQEIEAESRKVASHSGTKRVLPSILIDLEKPSSSKNVSQLIRPKRNSAKRVDYSKFDANDDSDEGNPNQPPPSKKQKVKENTTATRRNYGISILVKKSTASSLINKNSTDSAYDDQETDTANSCDEKIDSVECGSSQELEGCKEKIRDNGTGNQRMLYINETKSSQEKDEDADVDDSSMHPQKSTSDLNDKDENGPEENKETANANEVIVSFEGEIKEVHHNEVVSSKIAVSDINTVSSHQNQFDKDGVTPSSSQESETVSTDFLFEDVKQTSLFLKMMDLAKTENDEIVYDLPITRNIIRPEYTRLSSIMLKIWDLEVINQKGQLELLEDHEYYDYLFKFLHVGIIDVKDGKKLIKMLSYLLLNQITKPYITAMFTIQTVKNLSTEVFLSFLDNLGCVDFKEYEDFIHVICVLYLLNLPDPIAILPDNCPRNIQPCLARIMRIMDRYESRHDTLFLETKTINGMIECILNDLYEKYLSADQKHFVFKCISYPYMHRVHTYSILCSKSKENILLILLKEVYDYKKFHNFKIVTKNPKRQKESYAFCREIVVLFSKSRKETLENEERVMESDKCLKKACNFLYKKMLDSSFHRQLPSSEIIESVLYLCDAFKLRNSRSFVTPKKDIESIVNQYPDQCNVLVPFFMNSGEDSADESSNLFLKNSKTWFTKEIVCKLSETILVAILKSDDLYAEDELTVAQMCYDWAIAQSEQSGKGIKFHFDKVKNFVRFPLINVYEFKRKFVPYGLLDTKTEVHPIILKGVTNDYESPFSSAQRNSTIILPEAQL